MYSSRARFGDVPRVFVCKCVCWPLEGVIYANGPCDCVICTIHVYTRPCVCIMNGKDVTRISTRAMYENIMMDPSKNFGYENIMFISHTVDRQKNVFEIDSHCGTYTFCMCAGSGNAQRRTTPLIHMLYYNS